MLPWTAKRVVRSTGLSWSHCKPSSNPLDVLALLFFYTLAGLPLGFGEVIPLLLQVHRITDESIWFNFRLLWLVPQVLRVLWAPLVDGLYFESFGRRRCWLVMTQVSLGALLLVMSSAMTSMLQAGSIWALGTICLCLSILSATHEIVVDGLALDWLRAGSRHCHAACSLGGQAMGRFIAGSLTTALWSQGTTMPPEAFRLGGVAFLTVAVMTALFFVETSPKAGHVSLRGQYQGLTAVASNATVISVLLCSILTELPIISERMYVPKMYEQQIPRHYPVVLDMAMTSLSPMLIFALTGVLAQTRASGIFRVSFKARCFCSLVLQAYLVAKASPIMTVKNSNMFPEHGVRTDNDENHYIHPFVRFLLLFLPIVTIDYKIFGYLVVMTWTSAATSWLSLASKGALLAVALEAAARRPISNLRGSTVLALLKAVALAGELISEVTAHGCLPFLRGGLGISSFRGFLSDVLPDLPEQIAVYHIFVVLAVGSGLCALGVQKRHFDALQGRNSKGA
eukprot:TRINITY_DN84281_c0_g1_i1.p1 TRINITY_DN84281_c0_g1~~TRINITY_DN84281_c0_g1_i1.p1  ORF type:complete len:541 (-),score=30.00 TRINITY_DN84281_c0_g1_i1:287-1819(-)